MSEVILGGPFFSLPSLNLDNNLSEFILDTEVYEKEIAKRNGGLELFSILQNSVSYGDIMHYEKIIPFHRQTSSKEMMSEVIELAKNYPDPFSKKINNLKELEKDILTVYQVAYSHYVIAKNEGFTNDGILFPCSNCGPSSRDVLGSLWLHGFFNSAYALSNFPNHGYVILPFVLKEPDFKGVILLDPTSDQLGKYNEKEYRNLVTIKSGSKWYYKTAYGFGMNLFPDEIYYLGTLLNPGSIDGTGNLVDDRYTEYFNFGRKYLDLAFSNPIDFNSMKK